RRGRSHRSRRGGKHRVPAGSIYPDSWLRPGGRRRSLLRAPQRHSRARHRDKTPADPEGIPVRGERLLGVGGGCRADSEISRGGFSLRNAVLPYSCSEGFLTEFCDSSHPLTCAKPFSSSVFSMTPTSAGWSRLAPEDSFSA